MLDYYEYLGLRYTANEMTIWSAVATFAQMIAIVASLIRMYELRCAEALLGRAHARTHARLQVKGGGPQDRRAAKHDQVQSLVVLKLSSVMTGDIALGYAYTHVCIHGYTHVKTHV